MGRSVRLTTALLAGVLAILVATSPVAADHTLFVGSHHTTDGHFNAAQELTDVTVTGTGPGTSVVLDEADGTIDSFEDVDIAEYSGATGDWTVNLNDQSDGTYSLRSTSTPSGQIISTSGLPRYYEHEGNYTVDVKLNAATANASVIFGAADLQNSYAVRINQSGLQAILRDSGTGGQQLSIASSTGTIPTNEFLTVDANLSGPENDDLNVTVTDSSDVVVATLSTDMNVDPDGVGIGFMANQSDVVFDNASVVGANLDKQPTGTYISQNHTAGNAQRGFTNLTLTNATAHVTWQGSNGATWTDIASDSYTTTGNRSFALGTQYDVYRVNVTFVDGTGETEAQLHDEGVLVTNREPVLSNLSPADDASVSGGSVTLEADVADRNLDQGETVTVNFTVNGSVVDSQTITSNQTVSTSVSVGSGEHTWSVSAEDNSHIVDSATRTFLTPGEIRVYDGDAPATLLDHKTIDAEYIGTGATSNFREERSTNNGTLPLRGLPSEELRVRLNASGYAERVLIIDSPSETRQTVMYNLSSAATFEQCFQLDSRGAGFAPDETELVVQGYLNGQWRDISGKYFGAANLACFSLTDNEDYRLVVTDGDQTRNLGGYEADKSFENEVITLIVEGLTFGLDRGEDYRWQAIATNESGSPEIQFQIDSQDQALEDLEITIWERNNETNVLDTISETGPVGVYAANFPLTSEQADKEWVVNWTAEYPDGEVATGQTIVSIQGSASTIIPDGTPSVVVLGLAVGLVVLLAMVFSQLHAGIGMAITVAFAGLLMLLDLLPISEGVFALAVGLAVVGYVGLGVFGR